MYVFKGVLELRMYVCMYVCMYVYKPLNRESCVCMYVCMPVCMYVYKPLNGDFPCDLEKWCGGGGKEEDFSTNNTESNSETHVSLSMIR